MYENQLLDCIDVIQEQSTLAELNVMNSLIDSYMKSSMILEASDASSALLDAGPIKGLPNESILKKIIMFIPRLIISFLKIILKAVKTIIRVMTLKFKIVFTVGQTMKLPFDPYEMQEFDVILYRVTEDMDKWASSPTMIDQMDVRKAKSIHASMRKYEKGKSGWKTIFTETTAELYTPANADDVNKSFSAILNTLYSAHSNIETALKKFTDRRDQLSEKMLKDNKDLGNKKGNIEALEHNFAAVSTFLTKSGVIVSDVANNFYEITKDLTLDMKKNMNPKKKIKVTVYFWFEGWDADCFEIIDAVMVRLNLEFASDSNVE